jgi:hypothetical protein
MWLPANLNRFGEGVARRCQIPRNPERVAQAHGGEVEQVQLFFRHEREGLSGEP